VLEAITATGVEMWHATGYRDGGAHVSKLRELTAEQLT
jgi:hypothetical protein